MILKEKTRPTYSVVDCRPRIQGKQGVGIVGLPLDDAHSLAYARVCCTIDTQAVLPLADGPWTYELLQLLEFR